MSDQVISALIGLGGVVVGLFGRDVVMALLVARQKREQELSDRNEARNRAERDVFRIYADPLFEAARSLRFRLDEIINQGRAGYLLSSKAKNEFHEYKRISTLYRVAVLLGWIRAFRRERSYLDPSDARRETEDDAIGKIERALADGHHVESQRLDEFCRLWKLSSNAVPSGGERLRLAAGLNSLTKEFLATRGCLSASDLTDDLKFELVQECAELIAQQTRTEIPTELVRATKAEAVLFLGIKEAYIYRDWQAAIGDLMIVSGSGGSRRFDIIGFGEFEDRYIQSEGLQQTASASRWLKRLEAVFHDLDMTHTGIFDARREQVRNLRQACLDLEAQLSPQNSN